jgi:myo-inositol-1(or 4)-monophosphatase
VSQAFTSPLSEPLPDWIDWVARVEAITDQVGQQLLLDFGSARAVEKSDGSLVTRSDQWADAALREAIATQFPGHGVLSEEGQHRFPDTDWCWIIDPIDGTTNFTRGIPLWGISLGLLYRGVPVFGHVRIPPLKSCFHGFWYGDSGLTGPTGAFHNHQPIRVSMEQPSPNHFFSLCARSTQVLQHPFPCKIRMLGVATYNLLTVATGASLGAVEATPKIWDIAAVWAIVQAAGAVWVPLDNAAVFPLQPGQDYSTRPYPTLVASRPDLGEQFRPLVSCVVR